MVEIFFLLFLHKLNFVDWKPISQIPTPQNCLRQPNLQPYQKDIFEMIWRQQLSLSISTFLFCQSW